MTVDQYPFCQPSPKCLENLSTSDCRQGQINHWANRANARGLRVWISKYNQSLDVVWLCQVRMLKKKFFNTSSASSAQAMATCENMVSCNFYLSTWSQINFQRNCNDKKPIYLTFGRAVSGLNVDEPKFSSLRTLHVELKERKCEIRWFKLCSSKLTTTSLTRSDLSAI